MTKEPDIKKGEKKIIMDAKCLIAHFESNLHLIRRGYYCIE